MSTVTASIPTFSLDHLRRCFAEKGYMLTLEVRKPEKEGEGIVSRVIVRGVRLRWKRVIGHPLKTPLDVIEAILPLLRQHENVRVFEAVVKFLWDAAPFLVKNKRAIDLVKTLIKIALDKRRTEIYFHSKSRITVMRGKEVRTVGPSQLPQTVMELCMLPGRGLKSKEFCRIAAELAKLWLYLNYPTQYHAIMGIKV